MNTQKTFKQRQESAIHHYIRQKLGSAYSWYDDELWYIGNPISDIWQTETERRAVFAALRNWHEVITA